MRPSSRPLACLLLLALALPVVSACKRSQPTADETQVALPRVDDARTDLLFSWVDEKGEVHVEASAKGVPANGRGLVRVVDPAVLAPSGKIFLVDLSGARPDGTYAVRLAPRDELESVIEARRRANGTALTAGSAAPKRQVDEAPAVIVYGASWCNPCHQVEAHLKQKGIPFVHKDIEADATADREMRTKLARAGKSGGSIPVIDVRGQILIGYDPGSLDRALARPN